MKEPDLPALRRALLAWYHIQKRDLPWRRTRDPYRIWISETMLQQTRVAAVIPFFDRFLRRFPDVQALAAAPEQELLAAWAGLGYYYRARNLQKAARQILEAGAFPNTFDGIANLPGVGPYTAAAVASIAFDLPQAVVDGNVYRVLSRIYNDSTNIASARALKHFTRIADSLLDRSAPREFNQALMELGATVCLPKNPTCLLCPLASFCLAHQGGDPAGLPVKTGVKKSIEENRSLFWIVRDGSVLVWQRPATSRLMPGFWELPEKPQLPSAVPLERLTEFRHGITFHDYRFEVWRCDLQEDFELGPCTWIALEELESMPVSTILRKVLRKVLPTVQRSAAAV